MKARVIETGVIEEFQANELNDYFTKDGVHYKGLELDFKNIEPDYWEKLKHQAAIAAMRGLMSKEILDTPDSLLSHAIYYATALIDKLKNEK